MFSNKKGKQSDLHSGCTGSAGCSSAAVGSCSSEEGCSGLHRAAVVVVGAAGDLRWPRNRQPDSHHHHRHCQSLLPRVRHLAAGCSQKSVSRRRTCEQETKLFKFNRVVYSRRRRCWCLTPGGTEGTAAAGCSRRSWTVGCSSCWMAGCCCCCCRSHQSCRAAWSDCSRHRLGWTVESHSLLGMRWVRVKTWRSGEGENVNGTD